MPYHYHTPLKRKISSGLRQDPKKTQILTGSVLDLIVLSTITSGLDNLHNVFFSTLLQYMISIGILFNAFSNSTNAQTSVVQLFFPKSKIN